MTPGFIEIGGVYYATMKTASSETIMTEGGKRLEFTTASAALTAARDAVRMLLNPKSEIPPASEAIDPFKEWKREKAEELARLRDDFTLAGIKVEKRRRRCIRP